MIFYITAFILELMSGAMMRIFARARYGRAIAGLKAGSRPHFVQTTQKISRWATLLARVGIDD